jgi:LCP family protein required for cell wall assembly
VPPRAHAANPDRQEVPVARLPSDDGDARSGQNGDHGESPENDERAELDTTGEHDPGSGESRDSRGSDSGTPAAEQPDADESLFDSLWRPEPTSASDEAPAVAAFHASSAEADGYRPDRVDSSSEAVSSGDARPARSRRSLILRYTAIGTAAVLALLVGIGGYVYAKLDGNLSTFDAGGLSHNRPAEAAANAQGQRPENILLIGSDSRSGSANEQLGGGDAAGARSDTTILLHVYADHKHAVGVSIPRDAIVDIPSCRLPNGKWTAAQQDVMFNAAFAVGGYPGGNVACTQNTVERLTGIRIDHTVVIDFAGFAAMTDALGGVQVCVPNNVDSYGIHLTKGIQTLKGQQALSYVRARHGLGDGSDIGRMKRQQAFLSAVLKKVLAQGIFSNPVRLYDLANAATKSMTVDPGLDSVPKLISFADSLRGIKLDDVSFVTPPWRYDGSRVELVHPDVDTLWQLLREDHTLNGATTGSGGATTTPAPITPPSQVAVAVDNGTTTNGLASATAQRLRDLGFDTRGFANAASSDHTTTTITYGPGQLDAARELARYVPAKLVAGGSGSTLMLTLGTDFSSVRDTPSPTATSTPSSVPTSIAQNTRPADANVCSDVSFGS